MSLQRLKHVILTRYNLGLYDKEGAEKWMAHRMPYFEQTRESVLSQEGEFIWIIYMDKRTPNRWLQEIINDCRIWVMHDHPNTYKPDGWTITTRLDNDDILLPGAIKAIQKRAKEEERVLDLKYHQLYQGVLYSSGTERDGWERPRPNSPFLSLVSKEKNCYARPHSKMPQDFDCRFASNKVLAHMVIHDNNLGNKIVGRKI